MERKCDKSTCQKLNNYSVDQTTIKMIIFKQNESNFFEFTASKTFIRLGSFLTPLMETHRSGLFCFLSIGTSKSCFAKHWEIACLTFSLHFAILYTLILKFKVATGKLHSRKILHFLRVSTHLQE